MSALARLAIGALPAFASLWPDDVKIAWFAAYEKLCEACRETGETPPAHPEVSEQSTQDQPNPFWPIFKETLLALKLARQYFDVDQKPDAQLFRTVDAAISKADTFLADPQQVESDVAGLAWDTSDPADLVWDTSKKPDPNCSTCHGHLMPGGCCLNCHGWGQPNA